MKLIGFVLALFCSAMALAQTTAGTVTSATPANTSTGSISGGLMPLLAERLQVRYFAEFLGPGVEKWDDNQISADTETRKSERVSDPINLFNQFSVRWLVAKDVRVFVEPRFTVQFGDRNDIANDAEAKGGNADLQPVVQEDHRLGAMWNYHASADGKLKNMFRAGARLPTSRASKEADITLQPELLHTTAYTFTPEHSVGFWVQGRYYWYEPKVDRERWRAYFSPSYTYTFNDKYSLFFMYEWEIQHAAAEGSRKYNYAKESLQDLYAGVNINLNPSLTLYPFIRMTQLNKVDTENMQIGAWIMGALF